MKRTLCKPLLTLLFILFFGLSAMGQPPPPGHGQQGDGDPKGVPIGSGVGLLLLMGAAYGAKKVYDARKHRVG